MQEVTHLFLSPQIAGILDIVATSLFVIYLVLQILHHKFMWYVYIPSCLAAAVTFFDSATWAFAALNVYYIVMGFVGIINWRKDAASAEEHKGFILLNKMSPKVLKISIAIAVIGIPALYFCYERGQSQCGRDTVSTPHTCQWYLFAVFLSPCSTTEQVRLNK